MRVLSLFDGISCGRLALQRAGIPVTQYYASEIDKYAIKVTQSNHPDTVQLGDITKWQEWDLPEIDLIMAGFPCQAWSSAGKQKGDNDPRGALVHDLIAIWKHYKPKHFMFENVKMKKEFIEYINGLFGVEPILINSALVSAQNRQRLYWTNIPGITQPEDRGLLLKDIIESGEVNACDIKSLSDNKRVKGLTENKSCVRPHRGDKKKSGISELGRILKPESKTDPITTSHAPKMLVDRYKSYCIDANYYKSGNLKSYFEKGSKQLVFEKPVRVGEIKNGGQGDRVYSAEGKSITLSAQSGGTSGNGSMLIEGQTQLTYRKLTPIECCRLQTLPDDYFDKSGISNTQRYKSIGNGWTVDVVAHIFKGMK